MIGHSSNLGKKIKKDHFHDTGMSQILEPICNNLGFTTKFRPSTVFDQALKGKYHGVFGIFC